MTTASPQRPQGGLTWRLVDRDLDELRIEAHSDPVPPRKAWGTGRGVRVCVLDSGVEGDHPLVGPVADYREVVQDEVGYQVAESAGGDAFGHGTACASIIRRTAPDCELYSVRVLGQSGSSTGDAMLAGLRWAVRQDFDVINMSLSTTRIRFAQELHALTDEAFFRRVVIVASAHNTPVESFPWRFASVISVGSHPWEDDPELYIYNPSPPVEFFALGQNVEVAWPGGRTIRGTGNSYATPFVAGLCAQVLSSHPRMTTFQLKNVLYQSAANVWAGTGGAK